jgi:hypothetical protein
VARRGREKTDDRQASRGLAATRLADEADCLALAGSRSTRTECPESVGTRFFLWETTGASSRWRVRSRPLGLTSSAKPQRIPLHERQRTKPRYVRPKEIVLDWDPAETRSGLPPFEITVVVDQIRVEKALSFVQQVVAEEKFRPVLTVEIMVDGCSQSRQFLGTIAFRVGDRPIAPKAEPIEKS